MIWPDPKCTGPHETDAVYRRWEHTTECNLATSAKTRRTKRITEIRKDIEPHRPERPA